MRQDLKGKLWHLYHVKPTQTVTDLEYSLRAEFTCWLNAGHSVFSTAVLLQGINSSSYVRVITFIMFNIYYALAWTHVNSHGT